MFQSNGPKLCRVKVPQFVVLVKFLPRFDGFVCCKASFLKSSSGEVDLDYSMFLKLPKPISLMSNFHFRFS